MHKGGVTFAELGDFLVELGFRESSELTRKRFAHPRTGTILLFRAYGPREIVKDRDLLVLRRQLVDNGLIEEDALDRFLQRASA